MTYVVFPVGFVQTVHTRSARKVLQICWLRSPQESLASKEVVCQIFRKDKGVLNVERDCVPSSGIDCFGMGGFVPDKARQLQMKPRKAQATAIGGR